MTEETKKEVAAFLANCREIAIEAIEDEYGRSLKIGHEDIVAYLDEEVGDADGCSLTEGFGQLVSEALRDEDEDEDEDE